MKKTVKILMVLLVGMMLTACGGDGGNEDVVMDEPMPAGSENAFLVELEFTEDEIIPDKITIPAGQEILFVIVNSDTKEGGLNEDHNLVAPEIGLREIIVVPGQTVRRLWKSYGEPGTYRAGCTIHPWIVMEITIE